jgi:hypothetical protein
VDHVVDGTQVPVARILGRQDRQLDSRRRVKGLKLPDLGQRVGSDLNRAGFAGG